MGKRGRFRDRVVNSRTRLPCVVCMCNRVGYEAFLRILGDDIHTIPPPPPPNRSFVRVVSCKIRRVARIDGVILVRIYPIGRVGGRCYVCGRLP